jgi:predicted amidohydrolase YtcJ
MPDRRELDRASRGTPVRIRDRTGHGWLFNTVALRRLGVSVSAGAERSAVPEGVLVERAHGGLATGFVADHIGWVGTRLGRISAESRIRAAVADLSRDLGRRGVVAVCDATATNDAAQIASLLRWRQRGALRQEVAFLSAPNAVVAGPARRRHVGVKFVDACDHRLGRAMRAGRRSGLAVAVHCIDPAETGAVLQSAAAIPACDRAPLRLEHAAFVPAEWVGHVRALGATVVTHPGFIHDHGDRYLGDPGLEPHEWLYRLKSWSRAGVPLAFASDAPFGPLDPLDALRAAATRRTAGGAVIGAEEALSGEPALHAITTVAARCSGLDRLGYGRLARGGPGAAVILSDDPRDPDRLPGVGLLATVIGGDVVD